MNRRSALPSYIIAAVITAGSSCANRSPESAGLVPATDSATADQRAARDAIVAEDMLRGRFPGVQVDQVPGGIVVRIRGVSSVNASNQPLFVIDGMTNEPGPGGALQGINPHEIEHIEVLKDIGSTSIYGLRGANGVVIIKTRRKR